jgi:ubiquinol-cytochrome c reductase cytochrome c subunit
VVIAEAIRVGPFEMPRFSEDQIPDEQAGHIAAFLGEVEEQRRTPVSRSEVA